jgi:LysM repeat protein
MVARQVARWLAPLALAATVVAIYVLVHDTLVKNTRHSTPPPHLTLTTTHTTATGSHPAPPPSRTYVVKSGDTLSGIAAHVHTSLSTLESLNPNVNAGALQTGQHLRLPAG